MTGNILAAVDMGSNAVRLLIHNVLDLGEGPVFRQTAYLRVPLRLGEDVFAGGRISAEKEGRIRDTMRGFAYLMRAYGVSRFSVCATSAMRDAENGQAIRAAVREDCGFDINIISGREEAEIVRESVDFNEVAGLKGNCVYMDVGGGSTEVVAYAGGQSVFSGSFRLGAVRSLAGAATGEERAVFVREVEGIGRVHVPSALIAFGGNINKAQELLGKKKHDTLRPEELAALCARLKDLSCEERMRLFGLNSHRADVIVPALEIFLLLLESCPSLQAIHVSRAGLADGLIRRLCRRPDMGQPIEEARI
ncbi:MAG: hypothetical protein FWG17_01950 [Desulfovibrionaceae bacterium]|nr:hypothetical protein [Desulfovibrionaceae bacterium]